MKLWINDIETKTHRLIKLNMLEHSDYKYLGEFNDMSLEKFFLEVQSDMDVQKNIKLLNYYGYLNLFIIAPTK